MIFFKIIFKRVLLIICIVVVILWSLFPFYTTFIASIAPHGNLPTSLFSIPEKLTFDFYKQVFFQERVTVWRSIGTSILIASITTLVVLLVSITSGYSLSRWRLRGRGIMMFLLLLIRMIPPIIIAIPIFQIFNKINLVDTIFGVALAHIPWCIPIGVWLMKAFYDTVPIELEEAAWVDGASIPRTIFNIIMPLIMPGVGVTTAFVFLESYNEYLYALTLSRNKIITVSVKIAGYTTMHKVDFQAMSVSAMISIIPMLIILILVRKYLAKGMTLGALKG